MKILTRIDLPFAVVLVAAAVAWALPLRAPNCNTGSHYALVEAIAHGQRTIDPYHGESCDISWWHDHYYSNKAPGLALISVPWYLALHALALVSPPRHGPYPQAMRSIPRRDLWLMGLWGAVLPALVLLVVLRRFCERRLPGTGTAAAALLAFGTILLPFGGLFFSHAFSALLGFAAYATLSGGTSIQRAGLAGLLGGAAIVVEYPNAITAGVLALVVLTGARSMPRALAYASGVAVGVAPLLGFNTWTYGSPFHLSYVGAILVPGRTGHDLLGANSIGFFGAGVPTPLHLLGLLAGSRGLLLTAPVLLLAPLGIRRLHRLGFRRDAVVIAVLAGTFLVFNAGYYNPAGGATPGPRFLICVLPFVAWPVAVAAQATPRLASVLLGLGVVVLYAADATQPLIGRHYTPLTWLRWVRQGSFTSTLLDPSRHGGLPAAVLGAAIVAGLLAGGASLLRPRAARALRPGR